MKKMIILICSVFMLTGCFNYTELNELGIVSALAISKTKDDNFLVDFQLINILESGENGLTESPTTVISGEGSTIMDAIRSLNLQSSKVFFSPDVEYVILDKSIMKNDLSEVVDFLARDTKLRLNFLIVTSTDNEPKDILASLSEFNVNSATNLSQMIDLSEKRYGASYSLTFLEYLKNFMEPGVTSVMPNIYVNGAPNEGENIEELKESEQDSFIEIKNLVAFSEDGEVIELNKNQSFGYNFLKNHILNASISAKCDGGYFSIETLKSNFKFDDKELKNNKINVMGEVSGEIVFYNCSDNLNDDDVLTKITKSLEDEIKSYVSSTLKLAKDKKTDFVGVGNYIYKNDINYFDFKKDNWNLDGLKNIDFDINVKCNIFKQGNLKGDI